MVQKRAIVAFVTLAIAEGLLWMLDSPPWRAHISSVQAGSAYLPDPDLGWVNRDGRRATSQGEPDAATRPQVILVGDSYTYGSGLADADTFAWRLQQIHPDIQVSNYGTPDYGSYQSYLRMDRELAGMSPDQSASTQVYYLFNAVHESRNVADPSWIRLLRHPDNGVFFPYAVLSDGALEGRQSSGDAIWRASRILRTAAMAEEYYEMAEAWTRTRNQREVTEAILIRMHHAAQLAHARFTVILFDLDAKDRLFYRNFLTSKNIAFLDCDHPELNDKSYRQPDGNPNAKLNDLIAQWIDAGSASAQASTGAATH